MLVSVFTENINVNQAQVISWQKLHQWISLLSLCVHLEQSQCRYLTNPTYTLFVVVSWKRGNPMQWPCTPVPWEFHFSVLSLLMLQMCLFIFTSLTGVIVYLSFFSNLYCSRLVYVDFMKLWKNSFFWQLTSPMRVSYVWRLPNWRLHTAWGFLQLIADVAW
jgi:hypothetical protein